MKILALELSSGRGSIAWREREEIKFAAEFANDRKHSGLFFENLQRCREQCGCPERIVVGLGPGSYAGTRIAIATAIGLQAASGAELVGLPSFCAMPVPELEYSVIGDARRQSFWFAQVRARACIEGPVLCSANELQARLEGSRSPVVSAENLPAFPQAMPIHPSAPILAQIASADSSADSSDLVRAPLEPIYMREPHITQPRAA